MRLFEERFLYTGKGAHCPQQAKNNVETCALQRAILDENDDNMKLEISRYRLHPGKKVRPDCCLHNHTKGGTTNMTFTRNSLIVSELVLLRLPSGNV